LLENHPKVRIQNSGHGESLTSRVNTCFLTVLLFACIQSLLVWTFDIERFLFLTLRHVKIVLSSITMVLMCATPCVYCLCKMDNTSEWTLYFSFLNSSRKAVITCEFYLSTETVLNACIVWTIMSVFWACEACMMRMKRLFYCDICMERMLI
jgi:hypothetical protein